MPTRRLFLGSLAAAGVWAVGVTSTGLPLAAQQRRPRATNDPVTREFMRQMRSAVTKMKAGNAEGARAASSVLLLMAAQVEASGLDLKLQAAAKKAGPNPGPADHAEMERLAKEMGSDILGVSVHVTPNPKFYGKPYEDLVRGDGLAVKLREGAAIVEAQSAKWPKDGFLVARLQLQDNGDPNAYRDCPVCVAASSAWSTMEYICAIAALVALIDPPAVAACTTAIGLWMALEAACQASRLFGC